MLLNVFKFHDIITFFRNQVARLGQMYYKLRIKVQCQNDCKETLTNLGSSIEDANEIKNGIIIDPIFNAGFYQIPSELKSKKVTLLIDTCEKGGYNPNTNTKQAQIVTGISSKSIRPYFIRRKNIKPNGVHCHFAVPESVILINADDEIVTITELNIVELVEENKAKIDEIELYKGHFESLPENLNKFEQAVVIAVDKANCENCTHSHYFTDTTTGYKPYKENQQWKNKE